MLIIVPQVFCNGVTFCPAGDDWVRLALKCIGRESVLREADDDSGGDISLLCEEIAALISILNDQPIQADEELTGLVDELFIDWVAGDISVPMQKQALPPKKRGEGPAVEKRFRSGEAKLSISSKPSAKGRSRSTLTKVTETFVEDASEGSFEEEDVLGFDVGGADIDSAPYDELPSLESLKAPPLSKTTKQRLKSVATLVSGRGSAKKKTYQCINGCGGKFKSWSRFVEHVRATGHML